MSTKPQLQQLADDAIRTFGHVDPEAWPLTPFVYILFMVVAAGLVFGFLLNFAGAFIFIERRIGGRMQARFGPNRNGPQGLLQFMADGLKCLFKEDLTPKDADVMLFRLSPYFCVLGMVLSYAALPFSSALIATDINIGILYILGVTSLVVIGVLMGGWGSNSKWALLGGMRAAAQVVSYEIPAAIAVMTVVIISGSLSMQDIVKAQYFWPWNWAIFHSPFVAACFFIYFISALAEASRTPFDLPEAESELVSGYNTEYSGMRFLMFFLGEFANIWVMSALAACLFFGGWQIPFTRVDDTGALAGWVKSGSGVLAMVLLIGAAIPAAAIAVQIARYRTRARAAIDRAEIPGLAPEGTRSLLKIGLDGAIVLHAVGAVALLGAAALQLKLWPERLADLRTSLVINGFELGYMAVKTLTFVFIVIQMRWTLPRLRIDQMMTLCWKYLVPVSIVCVIGTLGWELVVHAVPALGIAMRIAMFAAFLVVMALYVKKIRATYEADRVRHENMKGTPLFFPPWRLE